MKPELSSVAPSVKLHLDRCACGSRQGIKIDLIDYRFHPGGCGKLGKLCSLLLLAFLAALSVSHGQAPTLAIEARADRQLQLDWSADASGYVLEQTGGLGSATWTEVTNAPVVANGRKTVTISPGRSEQYFRLRSAVVSALTTIARVSPATGEANVSVHRETILEFSGVLAPSALVNSNDFRAEFNGRRLLSRIELSSDRRRLTLFYLEPIPGGARIRVSFRGDNVADSRGQMVDADGDGAPGGLAVIEFDTMSTTGIPGTAMIGYVFASEPLPSGGGFTNRPLEGVLVSVDGVEQRLFVMTEADGSFRLEPCPQGRFFVHIDGRTAVGSDWPNGAYYPVVGKTFEAVAGQTNNLAGGTGEIFLPLIQAGTLQAISATEPTTITFAPDLIAQNPALAGVTLTVPPNALFADDGTRGGKVGIAPVAPDRIPSPLPPGLDFPLVFTIQTDGPSNFDQPVAVRFPNLPNPSTGEKLGPGEKAALWSYNHDTGRWEIQGSMTVTADGNFVESDPGVGIRQPGWHSLNPGTEGEDGGGDDGGPCGEEWGGVEEALFGCALGAALELLELAPGLGCAISISSAVISNVQDCSDPEENCAASLVLNSLFGAAGCVPGLGLAGGVIQCAFELGSALGDYTACMAINSDPSLAPLSVAASKSQIRTTAPGFPSHPLEQQLLLNNHSRNLLVQVLGDERWVEAAGTDGVNTRAFGNALLTAIAATSEEGRRISPAERTALLTLPAPGGLGMDVRSAFLDRFDRFANGGMTPAETTAIRNAAEALGATSTELQNRGWTTTADGLKTVRRQAAVEYNQSRRGQPLVQRRLFFHLTDLETGLIRHGQTENSGEVASLPLIGGREYQISYLDPETLNIGTVLFVAGAAGTTTSIPRARLVPTQGDDRDEDGLIDRAELIVGTSPTNPDTDGDGAPDLQEIQEGQNPLDGLALPLGVVANVPLNGEASGICVEGNLAYLATGRYGMAIVDVTDPLQPRKLSEIELPGDNFEIVVSGSHRVAVIAARGEGSGPAAHLYFVDVADPALPRLRSTLDFPFFIADLELNEGLILLGSQREVRIYDPESGLELSSFETQGGVTGIMSTSDRIYVATSSALEIFENRLPQPSQLARLVVPLQSPDGAADVEMALDGGALFLGKSGGNVVLDVSDIAALNVLAQPAARIGSVRALTLNGGNRIVTLTSFAPTDNLNSAGELAIYDSSDPSKANTLLFSLRSLDGGQDLSLVSGLALIADRRSGLTIMNFLGPDSAGIAPVISFDPATIDSDSLTEGIQVRAGNLIRITPVVKDDTQTRTTELLVNGIVANSTTEFAGDLNFLAPSIAPGGAGPSLTLQIRSMDRGGNVSLSEPVAVQVVPDTRVPALLFSAPSNGGAAYAASSFSFRYTLPIEAGSIDLSRFELVSTGPDGLSNTIIAPGPVMASGATLTVGFNAPLVPGRYRLTLRSGFLRSVGGVSTSLDETMAFTVHDVPPGTALWVSNHDGFFSEGTNWIHGRVPSQEPIVIDRFNAKPVVTVDWGGFVTSLISETPLVFSSRPNLNVLSNFLARESVEVFSGFLVVNGDSTFLKLLTIGGGEVKVSGRFETHTNLVITNNGALTFEGPDATLALGGPVEGTNFSLSARGGAVIDWPGFAQYDDPGNFTGLFPSGTRFFAQGAGSRLTLADITTANGATNWNVRGIPSVRFEAVSGGTLVLPKLASLTGRTALIASGSGSVLDAPLLSNITGPVSQFVAELEAARDGIVNVPALTVLTRVKAVVGEEGILDGSTFQLTEDSSLEGVGTVSADVANLGVILLEQAPASLAIQGSMNLEQSAGIEVTIGLGADRTQNGHLQVTGSVALDGILDVKLANNYTPAAGDQFEILTAGSLTGAFSSATGLSLPNGLLLRVDVADGKVVLVVTQP